MSDFAGFMISLLALWIATKPATTTLSFGWHRAGTKEWQGVMGFDLEGLGRDVVVERGSDMALQWAYLQSVAEFNL